MRRLIWAFAVRTYHIVKNLMHWLIFNTYFGSLIKKSSGKWTSWFLSKLSSSRTILQTSEGNEAIELWLRCIARRRGGPENNLKYKHHMIIYCKTLIWWVFLFEAIGSLNNKNRQNETYSFEFSYTISNESIDTDKVYWFLHRFR